MGTSSDGHLFLFNKGGTVWTCLKRVHIGTNGKNVQDDLIKLLKALKDDEKYITEGLELWRSMSSEARTDDGLEDVNAKKGSDVHNEGETLYTVIRCDPPGGYLSEDTLIYIEEDIKPLKSIHLLWDVHSDFSNYAAIFTPSNSNMTKESIVDKVYGPFFVKNTRPELQDEVVERRDCRTRTKNCNLRILSLVLEGETAATDDAENGRPEGAHGVTMDDHSEDHSVLPNFSTHPFSYAPDPLGDSPCRGGENGGRMDDGKENNDSLIDERYLNLKRSILADISEIRQNVMCNMQQEDPFLYESTFFRDSAFLLDDLHNDFSFIDSYDVTMANMADDGLKMGIYGPLEGHNSMTFHSGHYCGLKTSGSLWSPHPSSIKSDGIGAKLFASMFKNYVSNQLASEFRIFYFGKSFYIGDLKFFVSNLEPANKPGYISQRTKIYFHVDSVQEYSKVVVAPLVDTLPTLYQYDLLNDHVKPFFRLNNHRIFHKGDVFKYSGIEFRIQQVTVTGSIFDVFKRAKCGRIGTDTEIVVDDPVRPRVLDLLSPQKVAILRETPPCYRESLFAKFTSELDHESLLRLHGTDTCSNVMCDATKSILNACTPSNRSDIHYALKCTVCYEPIYTNLHRQNLSTGDELKDEVTPSTAAETPSALVEPLNIKRLPCGHVFHKGCVYTWALNKNSCPNCRLQIDGTEKEGVLLPIVYNPSDEDELSLEDSDSYGTTNCNSLSDMEEYFKSLET